jgi:hypothetical protein
MIHSGIGHSRTGHLGLVILRLVVQWMVSSRIKYSEIVHSMTDLSKMILSSWCERAALCNCRSCTKIELPHFILSRRLNRPMGGDENRALALFSFPNPFQTLMFLYLPHFSYLDYYLLLNHSIPVITIPNYWAG